MSLDLTPIIVALLTLLIGGGSGGLITTIRANRRADREKAKAATGPREAVAVTELVQQLARTAVADADDRLDAMREEAADARATAGQAKQDAADARALAELLSRQLAQATAHIRDLEPLLREAGIAVPPWPPEPDPGDPVMSHDRRQGARPFAGPERRKHLVHREDPHG